MFASSYGFVTSQDITAGEVLFILPAINTTFRIIRHFVANFQKIKFQHIK